MLLAMFVWGLVGCSQKQSGEETKINEQQEPVQEEGIVQLNELMYTQDAVEAKVNTNIDSKTILKFEKGTPVFVIELTEDNWYMISYQDKNAYIQAIGLEKQQFDETVIKELQEMETDG